MIPMQYAKISVKSVKASNTTMILMQYAGILVESVKASNGSSFWQDS